MRWLQTCGRATTTTTGQLSGSVYICTYDTWDKKGVYRIYIIHMYEHSLFHSLFVVSVHLHVCIPVYMYGKKIGVNTYIGPQYSSLLSFFAVFMFFAFILIILIPPNFWGEADLAE